jgi:hypothetical protein
MQNIQHHTRLLLLVILYNTCHAASRGGDIQQNGIAMTILHKAWATSLSSNRCEQCVLSISWVKIRVWKIRPYSWSHDRICFIYSCGQREVLRNLQGIGHMHMQSIRLLGLLKHSIPSRLGCLFALTLKIRQIEMFIVTCKLSKSRTL